MQKNIEKEIKLLTRQVYSLLCCAGVVRIDYLVKDEKVYVNEINTIPGSLSVHMFDDMSAKELIEILISEAKKKNEQKKCLTTFFESEALRIYRDTVGAMKLKK